MDELPHQLRVTCPRDTLLLYDYFGDYRARLLDSNFLEVTYAVRGGSGFGLENTVILAVRNGRLRQVLLLMSSFEAVGPQYYHTLKTNSFLVVNRSGHRLLKVNSREYLKDVSHPAGMHKRFKPCVLRFDSDLMAFYEKMVIVHSAFTAAEVNFGNEYVHFSSGDTVPMVSPASETYWYAEGSWYTPVDGKMGLQEDTVIHKVLQLSVVQQQSARIDSVTRHRHGISLKMLESADWPSDTGHYVLQVGYRSRERFDPHYLFRVSQPTLVIDTIDRYQK